MASNAKNLAEYLNNQTTSATADIADGSITTAKLADDAVTSAKLGSGAAVANLGSGSITTAKLADNSITTAKITNGAVTQEDTVAYFGSTPTPMSNKNYFRNPNMAIAQRNPGSTGIYTGGIWKVLVIDGWLGHFDSSPSGALHGQFDGGPNSKNTKIAEVRGPNSGGNGSFYFGQRIERDNMQALLGTNSITISGYIKRSGSINATVSCNIICPTAKDNYASYTTHGAVFTSATMSGNGTVVGTSTLSLTSADTWYFFTITKTSFSSLTNITNGMQFYFGGGGAAGTSDKLQFTQMKLEAGTFATEFVPNTFEEDLNECKRYYQKSFDYGSAPTNGGSSSYSSSGALLGYSGSNNSGTLTDNWLFSPEMRAIPTVTRYGNSSGHWGRMSMPNSSVTYDNGAGYISNTRATGLNFGQNVAGDTHICGFGHAVADAEL